jgi:hypothetical protein
MTEPNICIPNCNLRQFSISTGILILANVRAKKRFQIRPDIGKLYWVIISGRFGTCPYNAIRDFMMKGRLSVAAP